MNSKIFVNKDKRTVVNEKILICDGCDNEWHVNIDEEPIIAEPFPHLVCPNCDWWIPMF